jgi:diacylglycerol kinase family enzyme
MYFYLVDSFLSEKKYEKIFARIENRIVDLGINGRITRLSLLKSATELIKEEIKRGAKTIVAIGNDKIIGQIINVIAEEDLTLGLIPVGENNQIAQALGIAENEAACDILSARRVEKLDLGKVNQNYFLFKAQIQSPEIILDSDNQYKINLLSKNNLITIYNLAVEAELKRVLPAEKNYHCFNPQDGILELIINPDKDSQKSFLKIFNWLGKKRTALTLAEKISFFPIKNINIKSKESVPVVLDQCIVTKTPAQVSVLPKALKIIVGKNRVF